MTFFELFESLNADAPDDCFRVYRSDHKDKMLLVAAMVYLANAIRDSAKPLEALYRL